jgi:hypothetical protein
MPLPDLTDDERAELVRLLRDAIAADKYFLSPQVKRLKSILAKVDPASAERTVTPYRHQSRQASRDPRGATRVNQLLPDWSQPAPIRSWLGSDQ